MNVVISKNAKKQYDHLPKPEQAKIKKKLIALERNPYIGKKLSGELSELHSLRAWPYRILYDINDKQKRIEVHKIAHRQEAYK